MGGGADRLPLPFLAEEGGEGRQVLGTVPVSMPLGKVLYRTFIPGPGMGAVQQWRGTLGTAITQGEVKCNTPTIHFRVKRHSSNMT